MTTANRNPGDENLVLIKEKNENPYILVTTLNKDGEKISEYKIFGKGSAIPSIDEYQNAG